jgi:hypothetical protein
MLKSPYTSTIERQFVEPNVVDEKDVQNNQSKDQNNELDQLKAFYKYLLAHSHLNIQLKDLKNIKLT